MGNSDIDYGTVDPVLDPEDLIYIDYGFVNDPIKGQWVEWWEWDRDKSYYPTNHVEVEVKIPIDEDYDTYIRRFTEQFYNLASTVLYIHRLVSSFYFGSNPSDPNNPDQNIGSFLGIQTGQPVSFEVHTFTSDPHRQFLYNQE